MTVNPRLAAAAKPADGGCVQEVGRHDNKEVDVVTT
jgi:hypothetical protein